MKALQGYWVEFNKCPNERADLVWRLGKRKCQAEFLGKNVGNLAKELEHQAATNHQTRLEIFSRGNVVVKSTESSRACPVLKMYAKANTG